MDDGQNYIMECLIDKNGEKYKVTVEVQRSQYEKPYLGGFKNVRNNLLYHHAFA